MTSEVINMMEVKSEEHENGHLTNGYCKVN